MSDVFRKTGPASVCEMFAAEAEGLAELAAAGAVRVPDVYGTGVDDGVAWIEMEKLHFEQPTAAVEYALGEGLAVLHGTTKARYGWHRDNTIGLTPQRNNWAGDWIGFFREHRLGYQLRLAAQNGYTGRLQEDGARLLKRLPIYFDDYTPEAALLHGDLWSGNWATPKPISR